ncbi:MAG: MMPL family transporter [Xanthomonadales bacterium]|nr:MMPL family transporter [Xanthomonadales bacterium]
MNAGKIAGFFIRWRIPVLVVIAILTLVFGWFAAQIEVNTIFTDLQPSGHPYIETNQEYKENFGGANLVTIMVKVEEGTIFRRPVLQVIRDLQRGLQYIDGVNQFQIISLASKKLKYVAASTEGFLAEPLMWPDLPATQQDIDRLRQNVIANPVVYGNYVSLDLSAAIVTVDFFDHLIDYEKVYPQIQDLLGEVRIPGVELKVVGQPILVGIIIEKLPETLKIVIIITAIIALILLVTKGTLRGMILPLVSAAISGVWALGIVQLFGVNLDPLGVVITFLISARAISHSVQLNLAFDKEREAGIENSRDAARSTLTKLLRPGLLGLATDAGAMAVVALTPIPLLQKAALIGSLWLGGMVICTIIMIPAILSWSRSHHEHRIVNIGADRGMNWLLERCNAVATHRGKASGVLVLAVAVLMVAGYFATGVYIGDSKPGSPILWPESEYNRANAAINEHFPGTDRMFLVVEGEEDDILKQPHVLENISRFQQYIEAQPEVGGTQSIADVIRPVNMILHEGNPRYFRIGHDRIANAEFLYIAMAGSDPGDIDRFVDYKYRNGAVQMNFRDHKGGTIRTALQAIRDYETDNPIDGANYRLAGGLIGVLAAVNEVIFSSQLQSIALALLLLFILCAVAYRSTQAGLFFLPTVVLSNAVTFAYMSLNEIGLNVNTLPVAALGIGLGVDYSFYIADRIKEHFAKTGSLSESIRFALMTAGRGVILTALTMVAAVVLWFFFSSLRFQAEMGLLIALWMTVSAISALLVIPSMIYVFRPRFLIGKRHVGA